MSAADDFWRRVHGEAPDDTTSGEVSLQDAAFVRDAAEIRRMDRLLRHALPAALGVRRQPLEERILSMWEQDTGQVAEDGRETDDGSLWASFAARVSDAGHGIYRRIGARRIWTGAGLAAAAGILAVASVHLLSPGPISWSAPDIQTRIRHRDGSVSRPPLYSEREFSDMFGLLRAEVARQWDGLEKDADHRLAGRRRKWRLSAKIQPISESGFALVVRARERSSERFTGEWLEQYASRDAFRGDIERLAFRICEDLAAGR
jgi:hypothetical protein